VRTNSLLKKALESNLEPNLDKLGEPEIFIVKKICSLREVLKSISGSYQTHQLAYYTLELAKNFHSYYAKNKIIDQDNVKTSQSRLFITKLVQETIGVCLDLLGISKPEKM
jgi:arginyl-tRNA synthetase